jgi:hypothetical protein
MSKLAAGVCVFLSFLICFPAFAAELTGREVMVLEDERPDGDDRTSMITMTLINKRDRKRVRQVKSFSKDYGKDKKSVMIFREPADVRKTAFLSWEYDDADREDDKWLYMPAMRKTRRISGASKNEYFMGTDFTYDDMGDRSVDEDVHTLVGEEPAMGHDCWKIESVPVDKEDMYARKVLWVSKTAHMIMQAAYYDKDGLLKVYKALEAEERNGFWTLLSSEMNNVSRQHRTLMETTEVCYDSGLDDSLFRVSTIQRGRLP